MADNRKRVQRTLRRQHQTSRLEDELWTLAYQQIQPVIRRSRPRVEVPVTSSQPHATTPVIRVAQGA